MIRTKCEADTLLDWSGHPMVGSATGQVLGENREYQAMGGREGKRRKRDFRLYFTSCHHTQIDVCTETLLLSQQGKTCVLDSGGTCVFTDDPHILPQTAVNLVFLLTGN